MEPSTVVWASARLAPVQIALWGHPETSGMASIDYYISSDPYHQAQDAAFGIESAQERFEEQLVRLDSLGFCFDRPLLTGWLQEVSSFPIRSL